jgi:hypothetical protein
MTVDAAPARPNFFIVGAPRCGTTWLYAALRQHPRVFMPERKEPGFFCRDLDSGSSADSMYFVRREADYLRLFDSGTDRPRRGEATTWYLYSSAAPGLIHAFDPDARVIAMLRNPVDMMYSLYRWRRAGGAEDRPTFEGALAAEPARWQGRELPRHARLLPAYRYLDAAHFGRQIQRYKDVFGPEQLLVLFLDDLQGDGGRQVAARACEFLGIPPSELPEPSGGPVNAGIATRPALVSWLYYQPQLVSAVRRWVPRSLYRMARRTSDRLTERPASRETIAGETRMRLQAELDDDVRLLERLLGRDLSEMWW